MRGSDRAFVLLGSVLLAGGAVASLVPRAPVAGPPRVVVQPLALPTTSRHAVLGSGETLAEVLGQVGVPPGELPRWVAAAAPHLPLRSLPVGMEVEGTDDHHGTVQCVRLIPDWQGAVVLRRQGDTVEGRREALPVERELVVVRGTVASSLIEALNAAGEGDELALAIADIFQWDIDFHREVQPGDSFAVVVERLVRDGRRLAYGRVLAAEYVGSGGPRRALAFVGDDGKPAYYDPAGRPMRKQFLRAPLRFSRVTSRFSSSRLHPVLGKRLPHWGVDYAAPVGTPVQATADGVVSFVGQRAGAGLTVEVQHRNGYTTGYLHLSRVPHRVTRGARVQQGEVIGYVGSTGLSTGPHLDYRIRRQGGYVNPARLAAEPLAPLAGERLAAFQRWANEVTPLLAVAGAVAPPVAAALRAAHPACFADTGQG